MSFPAINDAGYPECRSAGTGTELEEAGAGIKESTEVPGGAGEKTAGEETDAPLADKSGIRTEKTAVETPGGMALYAELPFYLGDAEWKLQKFAQADMMDLGDLLLVSKESPPPFPAAVPQ